MYSRSRVGPPKQTLATFSGTGILPMRSPLGRDAVDAVAGARPDVAVDVDAEAVRDAGRDFGEHAAVAQRAVRDLEGADVVRPVRVRPEAGIGDVERLSSGEKARPFGRWKSSTTTRRLPSRGSKR